ncbi:prolipoprotein diacylglyceryl transferase family protein [Kribbella sp. NPDC051952]|uniref:prolipoprotein diacylglyceryl transferase family protein n=1 Tax=Kribbella sp. NPDC051952 TaxID=3154851 RepID=UPI0034440EA5
MDRINHWFDQLPGPVVWITGRERPAFRVAGEIGLLAAMLTFLAGLLVRGLPPMVGAGVVAVSVTGFFAEALLRRLVTGRESLVLLEHVWVTMGLAAGYLAALGEPVSSWLDVLAVGLTVFLAAGRVGCLLGGCCHGYPSIIGPRAAASGDGSWPVIRLFPLPLVEALGLALLAVAGFAGLLRLRAGWTAIGLGLAYALLRSGTELLRGDRPYSRLRVSAARWMALIQLIALLVVASVWSGSRVDLAQVAAPAVVLTAATVIFVVGRRPPALTLELVRRLRAAADQASPTPSTVPIARGVTATIARSTAGLELAVHGLPPAGATRLADLAFGSMTGSDQQAARLNGSRISYFAAR